MESDQSETIRDFLASVTAAKLQLRIDVPGWVLRQAPVAEVEDEIAFVIAESKPGEHLPFVLPHSAASCICLTKGSASLTSGGSVTEMTAPRFHVLGGADQRELTPLVHPTTAVCLFFRAGGLSGGFAVDSR